MKIKLFEFIKWVCIDIYRIIKFGRGFNEYGLTVFCGRQGAGKTMGMVWYLEKIKARYSDCIIVTNFGYVGQDYEMSGWRDLVNIRNGTKGVVFAIDELQNEYDSTKWKDFPEQLLSQITMQRKQRIKIIGSSQVFTRVVKQLREQCFEVVECRTVLGRWTFLRAYDAVEYNATIENPDRRKRLFRLWRKSFVQSDYLRGRYDSYQVVEKMANLELLPRNERIVL